MFDIESGKIRDFIKFDVGQLVMVTGGRNVGRVGTIVSRQKHKGSFDIIVIKDSVGHEFATRSATATPWTLRLLCCSSSWDCTHYCCLFARPACVFLQARKRCRAARDHSLVVAPSILPPVKVALWSSKLCTLIMGIDLELCHIPKGRTSLSGSSSGCLGVLQSG